MTGSTRAVVLSGPGPVENPAVVGRPVPEPLPGWVRVEVGASGVNRSERVGELVVVV
ncbi:hypothetical protein B0I31_102557 [Saccharothrix carnea]|uniref:Alcohol dehydrogenase-like protein n=1 Tax=Saccharothrix carnea TaxID=1280637 RepID=A0A2P8IGI1_SACCR|nr:hypothetical protein [Saccharothrix carnea]PSL57578.1 hypothetical protein B0I31_102557 [Saccharothrix carnea]